MRSSLLALALLPVLAGCSLEPEESPLSGPGFEEDTGAFLGEEGDYVIALTYLKVRNAPGPGDRFGELATDAATNLFETEPEGWLGAGFRNIGRLQQFTMTAWESEEAMLEWVVSPVHVQAMTEIGDVSSEAKSTVLDVTEAELPFSWEEAVPVYDTLDCYQHPRMRSE